MLAQGHSGGCGHNTEQSNHINVPICTSTEQQSRERQVRKQHKHITQVRNTHNSPFLVCLVKQLWQSDSSPKPFRRRILKLTSPSSDDFKIPG